MSLAIRNLAWQQSSRQRRLTESDQTTLLFLLHMNLFMTLNGPSTMPTATQASLYLAVGV